MRGNITRLFVGECLKQQPRMLFSLAWILCCVSTHFLKQTVGRLRRYLQTYDQEKLDRELQSLCSELYHRLTRLLENYALDTQAMHTIFCKLLNKQSFKERICPTALALLRKHAQDPNTDLYLASASLEPLVSDFAEWIDTTYGIQLHAIGTQVTREKIEVCVGNNKKRMIQKYIAQHHGDASIKITHVYTDNQFLADLPLLLCADNRFVLQRHVCTLYSFLPRSVVESLTFIKV